MLAETARTNRIGVLSAMAAAFAFSVNDAAIKALSGDYPLHEVILIRSLIGMVLLLAVIVPLEGGYDLLRTRRAGLHILRGLCVVASNVTYFMGLAAMPLADAAAIFFVAPLLITALSVILLRESVGPRRWIAVGIGLAGVLVMLRPGSDAFRAVSLFPLVAALCYALLHTLTRHIGGTERASTMTFYILLTFIATSAAVGLVAGDGRFAGQGSPSLEFLLRAWVWPSGTDTTLFLLTGLGSALGGYFISQAYRLCPAGLAAPYEYVALPLSVLWGFAFFAEWPGPSSWTGIVLILFAGLYVFWRESDSEGRVKSGPRARR